VKKVSYYPGCSLHGTAREYEESIKGVAELLHIELQEVEDWTCCGATSAHSTDEELAINLAMRNLIIAEKQNLDLLVPCVACYNRFIVAEHEVKEHPEKFPLSYQGNMKIQYSLDFFSDETFYGELKEKIIKPLKGLKVVCYYGCLTVRPPKLTGIKQYENPEHMDKLMELLGAEPIQWSYKTDCCGASLVLTRTDIVRRLCGKLLTMAKESEADCIVTGCPMCQSNLDTRQEEISKETGESLEIPILYFTELMGLAMGHKDVKKWISHHITDPNKLLISKGLI